MCSAHSSNEGRNRALISFLTYLPQIHFSIELPLKAVGGPVILKGGTKAALSITAVAGMPMESPSEAASRNN